MSKMIRKTGALESPDIVDEVIHRVQIRRNTTKKARNLMLNNENYKKFEHLCKADDIFPSEVLDEFIALYIERRKKMSST
jgi:hypothetical protein